MYEFYQCCSMPGAAILIQMDCLFFRLMVGIPVLPHCCIVYIPEKNYRIIYIPEKNYCFPNPCKHDGVCHTIQQDPFFRCQCRRGFFGESCDSKNKHFIFKFQMIRYIYLLYQPWITPLVSERN